MPRSSKPAGHNRMDGLEIMWPFSSFYRISSIPQAPMTLTDLADLILFRCPVLFIPTLPFALLASHARHSFRMVPSLTIFLFGSLYYMI